MSTCGGRYEYGGDASGPPILLLHGLMGSAASWADQVPWLRRYGPVFAIDAAGHRGAEDARAGASAYSTESFVADVAEHLTMIDRGPAIVIGHSMGGLHGWCTAAAYPELVRALVVEDMAPDFRGRTTGDWRPWFDTWPARFDGEAHLLDFFGDVAGRYFARSFVDGVPHGDIGVWDGIASEWGLRDFSEQWRATTCPALLIEAGAGVTPPGQMAEMAAARGARADETRYLRVPGAGHLLHDERPAVYRGAVEAFLGSVLGR